MWLAIAYTIVAAIVLLVLYSKHLSVMEQNEKTIESLQRRVDRLYQYNTELLHDYNGLEKKYNECKNLAEKQDNKIHELTLQLYEPQECPVFNTCMDAMKQFYLQNNNSSKQFVYPNEDSIRKLCRAIDDSIIVDHIKIEAVVKNKKEQTEYITTLRDCKCESFRFSKNHMPCKHMIKLALNLGIPLYPEKKHKK